MHVFYNLIDLNMNASIIITHFFTYICWILGSLQLQICNTSLSIVQCHYRISLSPLWIFCQQTLTHKQMPLWHRKMVNAVAICSLTVRWDPTLVHLSSEICASSHRKCSKTIFIQKVSNKSLSSWKRQWPTPWCQRKSKKKNK